MTSKKQTKKPFRFLKIVDLCGFNGTIRRKLAHPKLIGSLLEFNFDKAFPVYERTQPAQMTQEAAPMQKGQHFVVLEIGTFMELTILTNGKIYQTPCGILVHSDLVE